MADGRLTGWHIRTHLDADRDMDLTGHVNTGITEAEALRIVDGIAAGLRGAGFAVDVDLTRTTSESR